MRTRTPFSPWNAASSRALAWLAVLPLVACGPQASRFVTSPASGLLPEDPAGTPMGAGSVLTSHNDPARTGQNLAETVLSPGTVSPASFGKLFSLPVDGVMYAQPLVVLGLQTQASGVYDVVYAATSHDTVYAFDADHPTQLLWQVSLLGDGETTVPSADVLSEDIYPEVGITGTPVIDPASRTLYVVAKSKAPGPQYVQRLHALDLETGLPRAGSPVIISASVVGHAPDAVDGAVAFNPLRQLQRPGLLLSNGVLWLAFGSHGDNDPYHGWLLGYDAHTLAPRGVFNTTPDGSEGAIWQAGGGVAADAAGALFFSTANGDFDADTGGRNLGDSVVSLSAGGALADWFAPYDQDVLAAFDLDLGSSGPMLLPDQPGPSPHLMVATGKTGLVYLLDRDNLGNYQEDSDSQIVQELPVGKEPGNAANGLYGTPAYWNGQVYVSAAGGPVLALQLAGGRLLKTPSSRTTEALPSGTVSISASADTGGIAWFIESHGSNAYRPAVLHAFDASDLGTELYSSATNPQRDQAGNAATFTVPTVSGGRVYVGTSTELDVYGLLP